MEYHSLSFPEALKDLAENTTYGYLRNISRQKKKKADYRENLYKVNELATLYFQNELAHSVRGKPGRDYFKKRSISDNIIKEFRLGYAPEGWDGLKRFL